ARFTSRVTIAAPSPIARDFVAWKLIIKGLLPELGRCSALKLSKAAAASTTTGMPVFSWKISQAPTSIGAPKGATGMTAPTSNSRAAAATVDGSRHQLFRSTSSSNGFSPAATAAAAVATKVQDGIAQ